MCPTCLFPLFFLLLFFLFLAITIMKVQIYLKAPKFCILCIDKLFHLFYVCNCVYFIFFLLIFLFCYMQGHFEIVSLSGSSTYTSGIGGAHGKNGMLSVSLAKPDGMVFGGVTESIIAATPIQVRSLLYIYLRLKWIGLTYVHF